MILDRTILAVVIMAGAITVAASDSGRGLGQEPSSASPSPSEEASRQAFITNKLTSLLTAVGVEVVESVQAPATQTFRQVQVHWETPNGDRSAVGPQQAAGTLTVKNSAPGIGNLPRRRSLELAETEVLVIALDGNSRLLWWNVMTDPRLLRAETVTASGQLSGGVSYLPQVDFSIAYPDDPAIEELRIYHPEWTGAEFRLTPLAVLNVP